MKHGIITEIDWALIGAQLAQESDVEQVEFFKSFVKECKTWGTNHQVEMQMACINHKLSAEERESLSMISYIATEGN